MERGNLSKGSGRGRPRVDVGFSRKVFVARAFDLYEGASADGLFRLRRVICSKYGEHTVTNPRSRDEDDIAGQESTWSSASKLSRKVRELAHRSHQALKRGTIGHEAHQPIDEDLRDLREQVRRLQRKIHERRLAALISWIDALQQMVETGLGDRGRKH
jgi:hypothetical protein